MEATTAIPRTPRQRPRSKPPQGSTIVYNYTIPLHALQAAGASHREIVRRLRLNLAIRLLLEAQAAADRDGAA